MEELKVKLKIERAAFESYYDYNIHAFNVNSKKDIPWWSIFIITPVFIFCILNLLFGVFVLFILYLGFIIGYFDSMTKQWREIRAFNKKHEEWVNKTMSYYQAGIKLNDLELVLYLDNEVDRFAWNKFLYTLQTKNFIVLSDNTQEKSLFIPKTACTEEEYQKIVEMAKIKIPNNYWSDFSDK